MPASTTPQETFHAKRNDMASLMATILVLYIVGSGISEVIIPELCTQPDDSGITCTAVKTCASKTQQVGDETIYWPSTNSEDSTLSHPQCLDVYFKPIYRTCYNGTWSPEPTCAHIQEDLYLCPDDLVYLKEAQICYTLSEPGAFLPSCPYENLMPFYNYTKFLKSILNATIWVPVTRNKTNGVMEWTEIGNNYGDPFSEPYDYSAGSDCIIYENFSQFQSVNCEDQYPTVCAYSILQNLTSSYCGQIFKSYNCMPKYFGVSTTCSCLVWAIDDHCEREAICDKYAEFEHPYMNYFPEMETCWFGLSVNSNERFIWSESQKPIRYSYWSDEVDFGYSFGGIKDWNGWVLMDDRSLSCGICEMEVDFKENSSLSLEFSERDKQLVLSVHYPEQLAPICLAGYGFKCFTDTSPHFFKNHYPNDSSFSSLEFENYSIFRYSPSIDGPGFYWCEAFQYPNLQLIKSNAVFVHDESSYGNEYAVVFSVTLEPSTEIIYEAIRMNSNTETIYKIRPMRILYEDNQTYRYLFHVTTNKCIAETFDDEYEIISEYVTKAITNITSSAKIENFTSCSFCYKTSLESNGLQLNWPTTEIGSYSHPNEVCFLANGSIPLRKCLGDFIFGSIWEEVDWSCVEVGQQSGVTVNLTQLLYSDDDSKAVFDALDDLCNYYGEFEAIDVNLVGKILEKYKEDSIDLETISRIMDSVMRSNRSILERAHDDFNATNNILYNYDVILGNSRLDEDVIMFEQDNLLVFVANLTANISGLALFEVNNSLVTESIILGDSIDDLLTEKDVLAAAVLPEQLLNQIHNSTSSKKLIITLFTSDTLFNSNNQTMTDISEIFSVLIPDFQEDFSSPIRIYFKPNYLNYNKTCAYWLYDNSSRWQPDADYQTYQNYVFCEFWHVTHFALLILENLDFVSDLPDNILDSLDVITTVNCCLSLFGLAGILLTSILFKSWRRNTGNRVLINFILAISLQICLFFLSSRLTSSALLCTISGALLHYSVISEFCWMLVVAVLQFRRFVQVFGGQPKYVLLKACFVGWALPLVPVICLLATDPKNYSSNATGLCYPSGWGFYLGVLLPLGLVLSINLIIYVVILSDVFIKKADTSHCLNSELIFQWRLVVLLFFMLGLTWSFGILAYFFESVLFVYLFCFTATLQGFVLFLFFIVFNNSTRMLYVRGIKHLWKHY